MLAAATGQREASPTPLDSFFQGTDGYERRYTVGDRYAFQVIDRFTRAAKPLAMRVSSVDVSNDRVEFNDGESAADLMGNSLRNLRGEFDTPRQFYPAELTVGRKWRTRFKQSRPDGRVYTFAYDLKIVGKERVTVPAGTFDTYRIEARGFNVELGAYIERNIWIAPDVSADIAHETMVRTRSGYIDQYDRQELVQIQLAR